MRVDARNNRIYWGESDNKRIQSADLNGRDLATVAFDIDVIGGIALDIDNISSTKKLQFSKLEISPNPASDFINLDTEIIGGVLNVTNNLGQIVLNQKLNRGANTVEINELNKGIYYFRITSETEQSFVEKVIVH